MDAIAIAASLREISVYMRLDGDMHRSRAYERAARTLDGVHDLDARVAAGDLIGLPGIGASIASVVTELHGKGEVGVLDRLRVRWPAPLVELAQLPDVGVKKARALVAALAPRDLDELAAMAAAGRVRELPGFGTTSEAKLLAALRTRHQRGEHMTLVDARPLATTLAEFLAGDPAAEAVHVCGGVRRWLEIIDRLAIVVATRAPGAIRDRLKRLPLVVEVAEAADGVLLAHLAEGALCELHLVAPERLGAAMILATGSPAHVAGVRARAAEAGRDLPAIAGDEATVYATLGLPWLPPEIRDGDDELARAAGGETFADLITVADVRGAVHCHTTYSDGRHSIEQMAGAAHERGLGYLTITDHSVSAHYAGGLDAGGLRAQWAELAEVQARVPIRLLRGTESDILVDGQLDYDADLLGELDVVIASIHNRHQLDEDGMTRRLVAAMRQPVFKIWGHALGRLVLRRDPVACRFDEVLDAIVDSPTAIEINGDPHRLDLDPVRARQAHARGVRFVLSSDAHSMRELDNLEWAVAMARRARLRPADVLNTLPPDEFAAAVRPRRAG